MEGRNHGRTELSQLHLFRLRPGVVAPRVWLGEPILPMCANHPQWPGQLHEVPGVPCKNYRRKPTAPQGDVRLIPLTEGHYAYVDAADYEWLSQWNWHLARGGYAARNDKGKTIFMHREIMQPPKGKVVDHHDGNRANNCRFNLRICTRQENRRNVPGQRRKRSRTQKAKASKIGRKKRTQEGHLHDPRPNPPVGANHDSPRPPSRNARRISRHRGHRQHRDLG